MSRYLSAKRPVLFLSNGYGDFILNAPAVRALHALFPGRVDFLTRTHGSRYFYRDLPWRVVHEVEVERLPGNKGQKFDAAALARRLEGCDLLVSLNTWHNPWVDELLEALNPRWTIGMHPVFDVFLGSSREHAADAAFGAIRTMDGSREILDFAQPLPVEPEVRCYASSLTEFLPAGYRILLVHDESIPEKMYPLERLRPLLLDFLARHDDYVVLALAQRPQNLEADDGHRILEYAGLPLQVALALGESADLFLGIDSLHLHVADLAGVPGVGLYGPTDPARWGFRFAPNRTLVAPEKRMEQIEPAEILAALEEMVQENRTERPRRHREAEV